MIRITVAGPLFLLVLGLQLSCGSDKPKAYDLTIERPRNQVEEEALRLFSNYLPEIENETTEVKFIRLISGDLNADSRTDAIVEFGKGLPGANGITIKEAAIYIQEKDQLAVWGAFEPEFCFNILRIQDSKLFVQELDACMTPHPEVIAVHSFQLVNNHFELIQD